jgi:quercetin dioxygenase-like cupin family protein
MMTITVNAAGAGETWSAGGADFRILADGSAVDGRWGLVECTLAPGWGGPPQHLHREHDESFFILTGTVKFTSGRDELLATPGTLVTAAIGAPHTFGNADDQAPASLLCTVTPERYVGLPQGARHATTRARRTTRPGRHSRPHEPVRHRALPSCLTERA